MKVADHQACSEGHLLDYVSRLKLCDVYSVLSDDSMVRRICLSPVKLDGSRVQSRSSEVCRRESRT